MDYGRQGRVVETASGFCHALEIAQRRRIERLAFGAIDFQGDTRSKSRACTARSCRPRRKWSGRAASWKR